MSFYLILLYLDLFCKFIRTPINVCKAYDDDMVHTCWTAKEWTTIHVRVIERNAIADYTLRLDARRSPLVSTHFLQQQQPAPTHLYQETAAYV